MSLGRRAAIECAGTAMLVAIVVGSGIMAERLAGGNAAIALLANAIATGAGLIALILALGPISGAHLNPIVTITLAARREFERRDAPLYVGAQLGGALLGVAAAHLMFELAPISISHHARDGIAQVASEAIATFGLVLVILLVGRRRDGSAPYAIGAYIVAAYWFTASTSFANPALTLARALTDTFAGIRPDDVGGFLLGQSAGAVLAASFAFWLEPGRAKESS